MARTGSKELDNSIEYLNAINCIYGEPASGKTTLCLLAATAEKGKIIFIDTENSFSTDRMKQIQGEIPKNLFLMKANSFKEQCAIIENLLKLKGKIGMVIIDSFTSYYRKEIQEKKDVNPKLSRQLSILSELTREGIPIILTSQVYSTLDNKINPVGGNMLKNWCKLIIKLEGGGERILTLEKHPDKKGLKANFEIINKGIRLNT